VELAPQPRRGDPPVHPPPGDAGGMRAAVTSASGADQAPVVRRGWVTGTLVLASMIYSIDWTIAAVALPHMQGTFSATQDQISWVLTSYIVASAVMLPATGWLAARLGRRRLFLVAVGGFTVFSLFCGMANSLAAEVLLRIAQGACGAFLIPLSQAIMLDAYPPEEHGRAMAYWGMGVVLGPVIGPTLGGILTDALTWRWVFFINLPVGSLALLGGLAFLPRTPPAEAPRPLDAFGFCTLALGVGAMQMMLDRGERLDWFESREIVIEAILMAAGLYFFVVHSLTSSRPLVDLRLMRDRNYALGMLLVFLYGVLTLAPMVLMPPFLQDLQDYPMATIGLLLSPRGLGLFMAMMILARLGPTIDRRLQIAAGFLLLAASSWWMAQWNLEVAASEVFWTGLLQGLGAGSIIGPLGVLTFATLAPAHRTEGASMWNLIRSIGSSIGIAAALAILVRTAGISRGELVEHVTAYNEIMRHGPLPGGGSVADPASLSVLELEIARQALMIGYVDVFYLCTLTSLFAMPLILLLGKPGRAR
jgi:MFS transporter, DHA2 family, multidrug resistance protein